RRIGGDGRLYRQISLQIKTAAPKGRRSFKTIAFKEAFDFSAGARKQDPSGRLRKAPRCPVPAFWSEGAGGRLPPRRRDADNAPGHPAATRGHPNTKRRRRTKRSHRGRLSLLRPG